MKTQVPQRGPAFGGSESTKKSRFPIGWVVFAAVLLLGGAGFWYYFFGKKPRVVLKVTLPQQYEGGAGMWPVGATEVLAFGNGELKLVDLTGRQVKWSAKLPERPEIDPKWRAGINARFVRLQQWAEQLGEKRAALKTDKDTKAFNEEAAKYQAELAATREMAATPLLVSAKKEEKAAEPKVPETPEKKQPLKKDPALKPISTPEMQLLEERLKRRKTQISAAQSAIKAKKAKAQTEIQLSVVADEERRLANLLTEQKTEDELLAALRGADKKPAEPAPVQETKPEEPEPFFVQPAEPFAAEVGSNLWLADKDRLTSLDRGTGNIKSDISLAGSVIQAWAREGEMCVVAAAGRDILQITRVTPNAGPVSLYVPTGAVDEAVAQFGAPGEKPEAIKWRAAFAGPLTRADIRLVEEKMVPREAIKPGAEKALTDTINNSAGNSSEEALALLKLMESDAQRLSGQTREFVDQSTYEVTLRRPLDATVPEWKGTVTGRVDLFATPKYQFLIAGTKLLAFDTNNQKLWEATLGARLQPSRDETDGDPCLEVGDRLYFADGAFLTAFEGASGKVLWRVPSIGIRKLQLDADGNLYVHSRNLAAESLTYAAGDHQETDPVLMKIDPATGKIAWQVEKYDDVWVSGSDVYGLRDSRNPADIENQVFGGKVPEARVKLYKLSRGSGTPIWEWYEPRRPRAVHACRRTVGMLFDQELQVLHSIAW